MFRDIGASLKNLVGGELKSYTDLINESRREAMDRMGQEAEALGAATGVSHGYTSCILLPVVLRYNEPVNSERQRCVSEAMGRPDDDAAEVIGDLIGDGATHSGE